MPEGLALRLGADVPVCLDPRPQFMAGVGEVLSPAPPLPPAWIVLVNPMVGVSTAAVFGALAVRDGPPAPPPPPLTGFDTLTDWLGTCRNDLEATAARLCPPISAVLRALAPAPLARMSGSGATCFALVPGVVEAEALSDRIRRAEPGWWVAAAPIGA